MNNIYLKTLLFIGSIFLFSACSSEEKKDTNKLTEQTKVKEQIAKVECCKALKGNFPLQLITNGKLIASNKAHLNFEGNTQIIKIHHHNGDFITKGTLIAEQDHMESLLQLKEAETGIKSSFLELKALALGFEPTSGDTSKIDKHILNNLKIQSGYEQALNRLNQAKHNYNKTFLYAPIDGSIANLETNEYQQPKDGKDFCWLINNQSFNAIGQLMESDLHWIQNNQMVEIRPIALEGQSFKGKVESINPYINENGLLNISAKVLNQNKLLCDGMNVEMVCSKSIPNQLVIPRKAIILRGDKKVVFTYKDGKAMWNYVETSFENEESIIITKGLKEGDEVIYSGHYNLNHETPVEVINSL